MIRGLIISVIISEQIPWLTLPKRASALDKLTNDAPTTLDDAHFFVLVSNKLLQLSKPATKKKRKRLTSKPFP